MPYFVGVVKVLGLDAANGMRRSGFDPLSTKPAEFIKYIRANSMGVVSESCEEKIIKNKVGL
jgi:hypothetical protein